LGRSPEKSSPEKLPEEELPGEGLCSYGDRRNLACRGKLALLEEGPLTNVTAPPQKENGRYRFGGSILTLIVMVSSANKLSTGFLFSPCIHSTPSQNFTPALGTCAAASEKLTSALFMEPPMKTGLHVERHVESGDGRDGDTV